MPKIIKDEEVFVAVMQIISEYGFAETTTKQMADAAKVSEVSLFRRYGTKLQLIKEAVSYLISQDDLLTQIRYTGDLNVDLLRVVQGYQESVVKYGQFIFMMLAELPRHHELAMLLDIPVGIYTSVAQLIKQYQTTGLLKPEDPMHALAALLGPLIFTSMIRKPMGDDAVSQLNVELHLTHFLEGRRL